jgi:hypothetical protein
MLRYVARFGIVRLVGRRAVPALLVWDLAMLANRSRRIPLVDRTLRRGAGAARRGAGAAGVEVRSRIRRSSRRRPPDVESAP